MPINPFVCQFENLPRSLPIFPLSGAVVMPGGELPLNIFEPRYLNMVQDAMASHRMFGMVQPLGGDHPEPEPVHGVGCAGRITSYRETGDGRILLVLSGVCRFDLVSELPTIRGYRIVVPDWSRFAGDYAEPASVAEGDARLMMTTLQQFLQQKELTADWDQLRRIQPAHLVDSLVSMLPLGETEKQALLETVPISDRLQLFTRLLQGDLHGQCSGLIN